MPRAKIIKFCLTCNTQIPTRYANRRKFCSRKCHYAYKVSDETREKLSVKAKEHWQSKEYVENQRIKHLGKKGTGAKKRFIKYCMYCGGLIKRRGNKSKYCSRECWRLSRIGKSMSEECKQKHSIQSKRVCSDPEFREQLRQNAIGNKSFSGKQHNMETISIMSSLSYKRWEDLEYVAKQQEACNNRPNKPELKLAAILDDIFPDSWAYTGDYGFNIGSKNPDFVSLDEFKVIDLFGDYWHRGQNPQDRIDYFAQFGYKTLVIWEHELKNVDLLKDKLCYLQYS